MRPMELRARRECLGLGQGPLAKILGVAQNTVSQWETGARAIPPGIRAELEHLEETVDTLTDRAVQAAEAVGDGALLITYGSDAAWWSAHPESDGLPAVLHRVAMASALKLAECRVELFDAADQPPVDHA